MCGVLGGDGTVSKGKYRGIAPACHMIVGKVLDRNGDGELEHLCKAIEWVLEQKKKYHIRILNISIGMERNVFEKKDEKINMLLKDAWKQGILVIVSAGNSGPTPRSLSAIAEAAEIISVGCHDKDYVAIRGKQCSEYSSRGPGIQVLKKPDIVAPGTEIVSCSHYCKRIKGKYINPYCRKSGTSMSTPLVAGAAALLMEKRPEISNEEVRRCLLQSAEDMGLPWCVQGHGFLNIKKSLEMSN